jgi:tRNA uridine 5-carboxymethylaminomethyl modification enzyme
MFTSRAEFRLHLRIDNADRRLTPHGRRLGLFRNQDWENYEARQQRLIALEQLLAMARVSPEKVAALLPEVTQSVAGQTYAQLLKRPEVTIEALAPLLFEEMQSRDAATFAPWLNGSSPDAKIPAFVRNEMKTVETEIKYAGYLNQQRKTMEKLRNSEQKSIPEWFDYAAVSGLSREMHEKLTKVRPQTLGQASRIPGVTPAALSLLHIYIEIQARQRKTLSTAS